ncbi:MAG: carboxypeptidase-like regulatory domain-containing protein [Planctomycetota bacterium]|nr:carboxypeptidase-like regulatory domain-containing protein [Planctomycetota bacterium]
MNRALPLVLVLALIAAAAFWLLQDPDPSPDDRLTVPVAEREADAAKDRAAPELGDEPSVEPAVDSSAGRTEVDSSAAAGPLSAATVLDWPADGVELSLVLAGTGEPAADALVRYIPCNDSVLRGWLFGLIHGDGKLPGGELAEAKSYRADGSGRVRVPDPDQAALVQVELAELCGYELLGGLFEPDLRVELDVPRSLEVRVEDGLGSTIGNQEVACDGPWSQVAWGWVRTDSSGALRLRNANTLLAAVYSPGPAPFELSTNTWDQQRVTEVVDLRAVPDEPVVLVLPAGGEVQVKVVGTDGNPIPESSNQVALEVIDGAGSRVLREHVFGDNVVRFSGLPPGAKVSARLGMFADSELVSGDEGLVPAAGSEPLLLLVTVEPPPDRGLRGRLVDAEGEPLGGTSYSFRSVLRMGGGSSSSTAGGRKTDSEGRFEEELGSHLTGVKDGESSLRLTFTVEREDGPDWVSEALAFTGELELPMELGDVTCAAPPLLVAGRVLDPGGEPVEGARVGVSFLPPGAAAPSQGGSSYELRHLEGQSSKQTGADGRFAVHAATTEARLYLSAAAEGYSPSEEVPFQAGATDVEVSLAGAGSLMGSLRFPEGTEPSSWTAGIQPLLEADRESFSPDTITGGWSSDGTWWDSNLDRGPNFGWNDLASGLYNVRIKLEGVSDPVRQWDQLLVVAGEVNRDARLQEVELDGLVTTVPLEVVDPKGAPVPGARVKAVGNQDWAAWTTLPGGLGSLAVIELPTEVLFQAEGFLSKSATLDGSALRIVLEPAPKVTLRLPAELEVPSDSALIAHFQAVAQPETPWFGLGSYEAEFEDGQCQIFAPSLGQVSVDLVLMTTVGFNRTMVGLDWPEGPFVLDLAAGSDGASFEVPVTQVMVDAAAE